MPDDIKRHGGTLLSKLAGCGILTLEQIVMNQPDDPLLPDFIIGQLPDHGCDILTADIGAQPVKACGNNIFGDVDRPFRRDGPHQGHLHHAAVQIRRGDPFWQAGVEIKHCCGITALPEHAVEPVSRIKRYAKRRKTDGRGVLLAEAAIQRHGGNTG